MTKEEAIKVLNMVESHGLADEAKRVAIKSLEKEPCEDCVSREQLKRELHAQMAVNAITKETAKDMLNHLPSVTPQPKTGHWILADEQIKEDVENDNYRFICSECQCSDIHAKGTIVPYCWKCGAKMIEPQESEDKE